MPARTAGNSCCLPTSSTMLSPSLIAAAGSRPRIISASPRLGEGRDEQLGGGRGADRVAGGTSVALVGLCDRLPDRCDHDAVIPALRQPWREVADGGDVRGL